MKTARGVYYNLHETEYILYCFDMEFYFSSKFNLRRFLERFEKEVLYFNVAANNIYKNIYSLDFTKLALVRLYRDIEKRGFLIKYKGVEFTCLENVQFVLDVKTEN